MVMNFNTESEKAPFTYRRNPLVENAFQIFQWKDDKGDYEPVGEYTLLDMAEDPELTEKTVMNIISGLNGRRDKLLNLQKMTSDRLLFQIVNKETLDADEHITIMFRTHDGKGVSKENAVLKIEKGVIYVRAKSKE